MMNAYYLATDTEEECFHDMVADFGKALLGQVKFKSLLKELSKGPCKILLRHATHPFLKVNTGKGGESFRALTLSARPIQELGVGDMFVGQEAFVAGILIGDESKSSKTVMVPQSWKAAQDRVRDACLLKAKKLFESTDMLLDCLPNARLELEILHENVESLGREASELSPLTLRELLRVFFERQLEVRSSFGRWVVWKGHHVVHETDSEDRSLSALYGGRAPRYPTGSVRVETGWSVLIGPLSWFMGSYGWGCVMQDAWIRLRCVCVTVMARTVLTVTAERLYEKQAMQEDEQGIIAAGTTEGR